MAVDCLALPGLFIELFWRVWGWGLSRKNTWTGAPLGGSFYINTVILSMSAVISIYLHNNACWLNGYNVRLIFMVS